MASVNFSGGKLHGSGEAFAQFRHSERDERMKHEHTNEDIDKTATRDNWSVQGLSYAEMQARYTERVAEIDKTASNRRKDRVTCVCAVVPVPEGMTDEQARDWYRDVWDTFEQHYGADNMIDACVHVDEKHDYIDPDTKETRTSRTHAHFYFVPERDGNFDAKNIVSRAEMRSLNQELDTISRERYGLRFMDGTRAKSRGTVEHMKRQSDTEELEIRAERARANARQAEQDRRAAEQAKAQAEQAKQAAQDAAFSAQVQAEQAELIIFESQEKERRVRDNIKHAQEQKLEALRERDAARSDRDVVKALSELQKAVYSPIDAEVDILAARDAKTHFGGRETPATVTISRDDFERLQRQAEVNTRTRQAAQEITKAYRGMQAAAQDINCNRIDSFDVVRDEVTRRQAAQIDELQGDLSRTRQALQEEQTRTWSLSGQVERLQEKADTLDRLAGAFPKTLQRLQEIDSLERQFDRKGLSRSKLSEYAELCKAAGIPTRDDIQEAIERPARSHDWDLSL